MKQLKEVVMKYEVIGWTNDTDRRFPTHSPVTACVELAVRKALQKGGYCFGGDVHEEYCPVLCDGSLVDLSWRGWGGVMARARGEEGELDYMHYYMNALIDPALIKYPAEQVDIKRIVSRLTLAEKFAMHLNSDMFDAMEKGKKRVEFRLFDEKRKAVDIGDYIEFFGNGGRILKRVADIYVDENFEKLFEQLTNKSYGSTFTPEEFGSPIGTDASEFAIAMSAIYPLETQFGGVLAFVLEDAAPRYAVSFSVRTDEQPGLLKAALGPDGIAGLLSFHDMEKTEKDLLKIAAFQRCAEGFCRCAEGNDFRETVGKVLRALFGKEEALKTLAKKLKLAFALEVTALFPSTPPVAPTLDVTADEFLHAINATVQILPIKLP